MPCYILISERFILVLLTGVNQKFNTFECLGSQIILWDHRVSTPFTVYGAPQSLYPGVNTIVRVLQISTWWFRETRKISYVNTKWMAPLSSESCVSVITCMSFQGDSGGPLVCEDGLAHGVVSFLYNTDSLPLHAYTNISYYGNWIDGILNGKINPK